MKEQVFYVAIAYEHTLPVIVESFNNSEDAELYATIMARNKKQNYIVLTPCYYAANIAD